MSNGCKMGFFTQRAIWAYSTLEAADWRSESTRAEWAYMPEMSGFRFAVPRSSPKVYFLKPSTSCVSFHVSLTHSQIASEPLKHHTLTKQHSRVSVSGICQYGGLGKNPLHVKRCNVTHS